MANAEYRDYFDGNAFQYDQYCKFGKRYFGAVLVLVAAIITFIMLAAMSLYNIYHEIVDVFSRTTGTFLGFIGMLQNFKEEVVLIVCLAMIIAYIATVLALNMMKLIGAAIVWILTILASGLSLLFLWLTKQYPEYLAIFIFLAILPPVILAFFWKKLRIASKLVNLTADMLMKNKRIFWNGLVYGILNALLTTGIFVIYTDYFIVLEDQSVTEIVIQFAETDFSQNWFVVAVTFLYFFLLQVSYNYYYGAVIHHAHAFYRNIKTGKTDGARVVSRRMRAVVVYALVSSILYIVQWVLKQMAKRSKDYEKLAKIGIQVVLTRKIMPGVINKQAITQRIADWAIKMLEKVWLLVNFFTLPAIIIENKGAFSAIKRSVEYVGANAVDVFIRKTAIRHVFRFTTAIFMLLCAGGGALTGLLLMDRMSLEPRTAIITFSILFFFSAGIPAWIMSKNLDVVYVSFLYCYLLDEDLRKSGIVPPSKFFGECNILDGKEYTITRGKKIYATIGLVLGFIAIGMATYATVTLLLADLALVHDVTMYHPWLETVTTWTGYATIVLMGALVLCLIARRKYIIITIVLGLAVALGLVIYINWFRPYLGQPPTLWDAELLRYFKILVGVLEIAAFIPLLVGAFIEISLLTQDLDVKANDEIQKKMQTVATGDFAPAKSS